MQHADLRSLDKIWSEEIYPIGNGRLGCAVFGLPDVERIQFNEDSLWVGNEVRVLLAADTNYLNDRVKGWRGPHPHARITNQLDHASAKAYDELMKAHVAE